MATQRHIPITKDQSSGKRDSVAPTAASNSDHRGRMKLLERYLKQHDHSAIKLAAENLQSLSFTNPLAIQFQANQDRLIKRSKKRRKYGAVFQYVSYLNKKFGLQHFLLILLVVVYSLVGGAIFEAIERPHEIENLSSLYQTLVQNIANFSEEIVSTVLKSNESARLSEVEMMTEAFYVNMLDTEGRFQNSVFDKVRDGRILWNFGSGVFYAITLFTTIGYGTIFCVTTWGRILSVIYATIGIPLILLVLSDLGRLLLLTLQKLYNRIYRIFRRTQLCREVDENDTVEHSFPLRIAIPLVAVYLLFCAIIIYLFDYQRRGDGAGLNFASSFYFSFISMSTIGLGDVMPNHIQYSPFVSALFMLGMVLFSVINSTIYMRMERNYFRAIEAMEEVLEELYREDVDENMRGRKVFKDMSDAIRIAALTLPDVDEERRVGEGCNGIPIPGDNRRASTSSYLSQTSVRSHRSRPYSGSSNVNSLMPTLGVLGFNLNSMREITEANESQEQLQSVPTKVRARSNSDSHLIFNHPTRSAQQLRWSQRTIKRVRREL